VFSDKGSPGSHEQCLDPPKPQRARRAECTGAVSVAMSVLGLPETPPD
jgi:hypothetical protein